MATSPESAHTDQPQLRRFGGFEFDPQTGIISRNGSKTRLQGQPLQLLELLLRQPGAVVTRQDIRLHLWPDGTVVEFEHSVNTAVKRLRAALEDDADHPTFIETVPRRGYRFIARVEDGARPPSSAEPPAPATAPQRSSQPLLAVTALAAPLILIAALAGWHAYSVRHRLTGNDVILLATFVNKTGDPVFNDSLDKALEAKLTESPFLSVLPEADVRATMRTMRLDPDGPVTPEVAIEVCKRQGLKAVVVPRIAAIGSEYLITLEAIDAQNQTPVARAQAEAHSKEKVIAALGQAASHLRTKLGESSNSLEKYDTPLDLATTSSLEALQAYRKGQTLYRAGKRYDAVAFFRRAVELDPQFCSAFSMLGSVYHSVGDNQAARENFAQAFKLKDRRLTQEENFQTTVLYYSSITGDLDKEVPVLVLYKDVYPRSASAYNLLGIAYAQQGRTEDALQEFRSAMDHAPVPSAQYNSNASQALLILGRMDEARKMLDQWQQQGAFTPIQLTLRYRIAFFQNDAATMQRLARAAPSDDIVWARTQLEFAVYRGSLNQLRSLSETLVTQQTHANRKENAADQLAVHAGVESYIGNFPLARKLCDQADKIGNNSANGVMNCAKALAGAGDVAQAQALAAKLDRLFPEDTLQQKLLLPVISSIIARTEGDTTRAVALLAPITQYPNEILFYHRAQAYAAAGQPAKAIDDFKTAIEHRGWPDWGLFCPLSQLGLARAYAAQGNVENSRKAYNDFFTTWKDADPDIPILKQAQAEYSKLK